MISKKIVPNFKNIFLFFIMLLFFQGCSSWNPPDVKDSPINDADMRKRNIEEGRGVNLGLGKNKSGTFDFATSNEMWRAALEILDFVPLSTADYGGGIIITDWYSDDLNSNESIKIMINFLSNEIRADTQVMKSTLENDIKLAVLKKAAQIKKTDGKKRAKDKDYSIVPSKE
jgi:hypothetical protein